MQARVFLAACASTALLAACNNTTPKDQTKTAPAETPAATAGTEPAPEPINLTGCLQKGDGNTYILTQINEPPKGEPVAKQDAKEAEHAYRLNAKPANDDDWPTMVGRQVLVSGTLAKPSDVAQQVGTSGSKDKTEIHESDLAQVDVADIQQLTASCGGHAAKKGAKPRRK